ncbi:hypothetical protein Tco_1534407, partial [Tanacetum coccineum]
MASSRGNNRYSSYNLIKISSSIGCDLPSTLGVKVNNVHALQLLQNVASNTTTSLAEVRWGTTVSFSSTVDSLESTNSKSSPQVDLPCHGCISDSTNQGHK